MLLALFPAWVPTDELLLALVVFVLAMLVMNRGRWWFVNIVAQDEPLLVAIGVFVVLVAGQLAGLGLGQPLVWQVAGALAIALGLLARYTDLLDIEGLI